MRWIIDGDYLYRKSVIESNSNLMLRSLGSSQVPSNTSSNFTLDIQVVFPEKYLHYVFILEKLLSYISSSAFGVHKYKVKHFINL